MAQNNILVTFIATEDSWGQNWSTKFVVSFDERIAHETQNKRLSPYYLYPVLLPLFETAEICFKFSLSFSH